MKFWENEKRTKNFEHLKAEPAVAKAPNQVRDASTMAGRLFNQPSLKPRIKFGMQALWQAGISNSRNSRNS